MSSYKPVSIFPFLKELEENWAEIQKEVQALEVNEKALKIINDMGAYANPKSQLYRIDGWGLFVFYVQGIKVTDLLKKHQFTPQNENATDAEINAFCNQWDQFFETCFPKSKKIIGNFFEKNNKCVTNITIFRLASKKMLPVHINYDPHMYRCHMGLVVPKGDIGMKVEGEMRNWEEGKFFIFDSMKPHTVWNFTEQARYVLNVDCFRPEAKKEDVQAVYNVLFNLRMNESKLTFGLSGGRSVMSLEDRLLYCCDHEKALINEKMDKKK